jgi:uncharacterized protein (DUF983 family)
MGVVVSTHEKRATGRAIWNGLRCRCPNCGEGKLFSGYLKVNPVCSQCGQELHHQRADDFPPYIAIMIVGHVLVAALLHLELTGAMVNPIIYLATLVPLAVVLPLIMLPSIKGAIIGVQWANRMHGFDHAHRESRST